MAGSNADGVRVKAFVPPLWWIAAALGATAVVLVMGFQVAPVASEISPLEAPSSGEELTQVLQRHGSVVRITLGLDYLFIGLYTVTFWGLYQWVRGQEPARFAIGLALLAALWDVSENTLLLSIVSQVGEGADVGDDVASLVVALSSVKWATAAGAVLLFGVALSAGDVPQRLIAITGFVFALVTTLSLLDLGGALASQARLVLMPVLLLVTGAVAVYLRWAGRSPTAREAA
ncbi:MAG: hypothetical protein ACE5NC_05910 [Anaerolineae bacterium]